MDNFFGFLGAYYLIPSLIIGMIGFLLGWFLKPSKKTVGDLSVEGEGALRAEADSLRARVQDLETRLSNRETEVSQLKTQISATPPVGEAETVTAKTTENDDTYALEWQNRYLAARVKYLDSRLADAAADATPAKSAPPKKASAKKASPKKAPAKKAPVKKSAAKTAKSAATAAPAKKSKSVKKVVTPKKPAAKTAKAKAAPAKTTKKKTAAKKAPAKSTAKKATDAKEAAKMNRYYENVKKYDGRASKTVVENIVKYCGVSLASRDSSLVACSDESELQTVAKGFVTNKLEQKDGQMELVKSVCEEMKGQRMKSRVTFYYLAARKVGKLDLFK